MAAKGGQVIGVGLHNISNQHELQRVQVRNLQLIHEIDGQNDENPSMTSEAGVKVPIIRGILFHQQAHIDHRFTD